VTDAEATAPADVGGAAVELEDPGEGEPAARHESAWRSVFRSAGARILVMPASAVLGVVNTRLVIDGFGRDAYAHYGLLVGIIGLLPFADLGMSAAIMNAVGSSDRPSTDRHVHNVLVSSIRALCGSGLALTAVAIVITIGGWWPEVMGQGLMQGGSPVVAVCVVLIGATFVVSFGQRVLTGLGKNHLQVIILGLQTPPVVICIWLVSHFGHGGSGVWLPVIPYLVTMLLYALCVVIAARLMRPAIGRSIRDVPRLRSVRGGRVFDVAWPTMIQMVALPIAMQTDELVISHVSTTKALAEYNLASSLYLPVFQVVTAAGIALWPIFARARAHGGRTESSPMSLARGFGAGALLGCAVLTLASGWLVQLASGGAIHLGPGILLAFTVYEVVLAYRYPLGMYMTDAPGLRFQAYLILVMVPINLGISIVLARSFGASGPIIGSAIGILVFQAIPFWFYVRRKLRLVERSAVAT
jgi:O-antigen/teichoic acid export membrane protein